MDYHVGCS